MSRTHFFFVAAALALGTPALAQGNAVALTSTVKLQKLQTVGGQQRVVEQEPKNVVPGDKLLFQTGYRNNGTAAATRFVITNPVPGAVAWTGEATSGLQVSVDGGRSFGTLASLRVKGADGQLRAAAPADVTHLRWTLASIAPAGTGQVQYRGVVR